jgi:homoserine acetyltransferase
MSGLTNDAVEYFDIPNFTFQEGTFLNHARLAYKQFNTAKTKIALIPTCFRGRIQSTLNFAQGALRDYRIIVVALFGNGELSSPSNTLGFPSTLGDRDCVRAQHQLLTQCLGLRSIDVIVGFSMGGQTAYHWLSLYPDMVKKAVIICSSARTSRHNYQFLEGPKAALESSSDYVPGSGKVGILEAPRGIRAFGKAYSAWLTSSMWFEQKCYKELGFRTLADWDRDITGTNYKGWDPRDLLAMLSMWQRGDVSLSSPELERSLENALGRVTAPVLLLPCQTDQYFYWGTSEKEARWMPNGQCKIIPSIWGHLAGAGSNGQDVEWLNKQITEFLETA